MEMSQQVSIISSILGKPKKEKNHIGRKHAKETIRHIWTVEEELLAISLYKAKASKEEVAKAIETTEIKLNSMMLKISNIKYLDTGVGMKNVSSVTEGLWLKHK